MAFFRHKVGDYAAMPQWPSGFSCHITRMKAFRVILKDGREFCVTAETYRHEGEQYVFDGAADDEVQFFCEDDVAGILIVPPDDSRPIEYKDEI